MVLEFQLLLILSFRLHFLDLKADLNSENAENGEAPASSLGMGLYTKPRQHNN